MSDSLSTPKQKGELYLASSLCDGLEDCNLRQVATLLKSTDADPNVLMPLHGITPFHLVIGNDSEAFAEEVTKLFLRHGGNPNVKSVDGMTPVHVAAAWGRTKILELLLANGGDPLCDDNDYCTPFNYAFQGEHYEAVSILSKFCIDCKDDDKPKFKRELDKVIINNGDVLAEYILSEESSLSESTKYSLKSGNFQNKNSFSSGYVPGSASTESNLKNKKSLDHKKKLRKKISCAKIDHTYNQKEDSFDFSRENEEEEMNLINEIISRLSSSVTSNADTSCQTKENNSFFGSQPNCSKRMKMTMKFNRFERNSKSDKEKLNSTLQVIKKHTRIPCFKNDNILYKLKKPCTISEKNFVSKESLVQNIVQNNQEQKTPKKNCLKGKWLDETIISKSPNLIIDNYSTEKKRMSQETPVNEKLVISKRSMNSTTVMLENTPKKIYELSNNCHTPLSRIPILKKSFTTPGNVKKTRRYIPIPKTAIPKKNKENTENKCDDLTPVLGKQKHIVKRNSLSWKNIAVNLNNCIYEKNLVGKNINTGMDSKLCNTKIKSNEDLEKQNKNFNLNCNMISGIELLNSEASTKSDSSLKNSSNENDIVLQELSHDLNQAIFNSKSMTNDFSNLNENAQEHNDFDSSVSCIMCAENESPDLSTSFLSLARYDGTNDLHDYLKTNNNSERKVSSSSPPSSKISVSPVFFSHDLSSCKKLSSEMFVSMEEEYKYEDLEEGIIFVERRLCVSPSCSSSEINTSYYSCSTSKSEPLPRELYFMDNVTLREKLKDLGENPGPITDTTYHVYLKRLHKLQSKENRRPKISHSTSSHSLDMEKELLKSSILSIDWIKDVDDFASLEQKIFQEFTTPDPTRKWREGTGKSSFNYLLLDPRITKDLPRRAANLNMSEKWQTFLSAIFYVGKGKKSRPYAHLYDAFKIWVSKDDQNFNSDKIQRILDIWNEDKGVIVLHVFHNTIPVEAYTREAAMIEALGTRKLGNCKGGDYYGIVSTWKSREKSELGRYFLFKALQILLLEGERQIFPYNL